MASQPVTVVNVSEWIQTNPAVLTGASIVQRWEKNGSRRAIMPGR